MEARPKSTRPPPSSTNPRVKKIAGIIGKVTGALVVLGSLAELVRQIVQLAGGK